MLISLVFLTGFGPFICDHTTVEDARRALKKGEAEYALGLLRGVDQPRSMVQKTAGVSRLLNEKIPGYQACLAQLATAQAGTEQNMMTRCCREVGGQTLTSGEPGCTQQAPCCLKEGPTVPTAWCGLGQR